MSALSLDRAEWGALQRGYTVGELLLPCGCAAVPKTSPPGKPFFAHMSGACETAPETQFHLAAKALIQRTAAGFGYAVRVEEVGIDEGSRWKADVMIDHADRRVAVEIQRSYQHLSDYRERQARYGNSNVFAVWLLSVEGYRRLCKSTGRERLRAEFGGRIPKGGYFPCVRDLPVACLEFEPEILIKGVRQLKASVDEWLRAIVEHRFTWMDRAWGIAADLQ